MYASSKLLEQMTDRARHLVRLAAAYSEEFSHSEIEPNDLLDALAHGAGISEHVLRATGYAQKEMPDVSLAAEQRIEESAHLNAILNESHEQARRLGHKYAGTEHLLLAMASIHRELFDDPEIIRREVLQILGYAVG
jgi:ATP-dependent Clp protease ATP-binding subunit ClpA